MMNFDYYIPTIVHFGRGQIEKLGAEIASRVTGSFNLIWIVFGALSLVLVATNVLAVKKGDGFSQMVD